MAIDEDKKKGRKMPKKVWVFNKVGKNDFPSNQISECISTIISSFLFIMTISCLQILNTKQEIS